VRIRFHIDRATGEPHIYGHGVSEQDVRDVLGSPLEDRQGREGARVALGQTRAGRYIRVIYVPDAEPRSVFVIIGPKAKLALRRRRRRKR